MTTLEKEAYCRYPIGSYMECQVIKKEEKYLVTQDIEFKEQNGYIYSYKKNTLYHKHYDPITKSWAKGSIKFLQVHYEIY